MARQYRQVVFWYVPSPMNGLTRRWRLRRPGEQDAASVPLFTRLLLARGLDDDESVRRFCNPLLTDLHDPDLLPGIGDAVKRIASAVRNGESIVIYGDYDVDGIAASAILYHVIKAVAPGTAIRVYVPHRLEEGYGLNTEALLRLRSEGADLAISVDCGVTAHEPARAAREAGLDLIITDHHNTPAAGEPLPPAVAIVHPRLPGSVYPFGELCGAGVAFKLAWAFAVHFCGSKRVGKSIQQVLLDMLPLAALATITDVVPLVDENRTIVSFGLRWIRDTKIIGLRALIEAADLMDADIDSHKVGFVLGPRLNACGRMGHADEAVRLLTDAGPDDARRIADRLTALNRERQQIERRITEQATRMAEDACMTGDDCRVIVLAHESWHAGVVGIACSRLVDRFSRPVVLMHRQDGVCKGSARSIEGYSIHDALKENSSYLTSFGGHDAAAGLTLGAENLDAFTAALTRHANTHIDVEQLTPGLWIDCEAEIGELEFEAVNRIASLSPFGRDNPRPAVCIRGATLAESPKQIGANGKHLTLSLRGDGRRWLRLVWFGAGSHAADLAKGMRVDAVIEPKINHFNGRTTVEGIVSDVRVLS
ncbi:MAG: single-stranded-DNA-specific exonuclease RecJ [Planctomycetota bacterium]|nr:MAG: single-stranded-DNA-specific exonuclease RecJ [Planctomycetota bacterium]